jgi:hypothetical protein
MPGLAKALAESMTAKHIRWLLTDKGYDKWWSATDSGFVI